MKQTNRMNRYQERVLTLRCWSSATVLVLAMSGAHTVHLNSHSISTLKKT